MTKLKVGSCFFHHLSLCSAEVCVPQLRKKLHLGLEDCTHAPQPSGLAKCWRIHCTILLGTGCSSRKSQVEDARGLGSIFVLYKPLFYDVFCWVSLEHLHRPHPLDGDSIVIPNLRQEVIDFEKSKTVLYGQWGFGGRTAFSGGQPDTRHLHDKQLATDYCSFLGFVQQSMGILLVKHPVW